MKVSFAAQVFNNTVANVLRNYYGKETHGTAKLCEYMDKFFDCLNVRNQIECVKKWKSFPQSYNNLTLFRMSFFGAAHGWERRGEKRTPFL